MHKSYPVLIKVSLFFLILTMAAFRQNFSLPADPVLEKIVAGFQDFMAANPGEKIFIQTSKPFYLAGDTIWYTGYVREAETFAPTTRSQFLYLRLVSPEREVVAEQKLLIKDGLVQGQVAVPTGITPGNYTLQATTRLMQNYDARLGFIRPL
jgi:uncharacterized protein YfaS (alpha-2-macroglobulin family)